MTIRGPGRIAIQPTAIREPLRLLSGGREVLEALRQRIASGDGSVTGELYEAAYHPLLTDLADAARNHRSVNVLVNAHVGESWLNVDTQGIDAMHQAGAVTASYDGGNAATRLWGHAKPWVFADTDKPVEAWIGNLAWAPQSLSRNELTAVLSDARAGAVLELTRSAMADDPARMRSAAEAAAQQGVLINDPRTGTSVLTEQMRATITGAVRGETVHVVAKGIDDPQMTKLIADAKGRGVNVDVYVRDIAPVDAEMLERAAVPTRVIGGVFPGWRINMISGPRDATLGTAFLWTDMTGVTGISSRDIGLLVQGDAQTQVMAAVNELQQAAGDGDTIGVARSLDQLKGTTSRQGVMTFAEARAQGLLPPIGA